MKIEFDTLVDGHKGAAALVALMAAMYPEEIAQVLEGAATRLEIDPHAPDGYNVDPAFKLSESLRPTPAAPAGALDTAGIPWDERIHAGTKTTNKDGTWSRRRNTPDATYDAVMAELKAKPATTEEASAADAFADPSEPAATESAPAVSAAPTTSATTAPSETPPPPPSSTGAMTFPQLMVKITKAQTAGKIDKAKVDEFLGAFGLDKIAGLASAGADTIAAVNAMVDEHVGA